MPILVLLIKSVFDEIVCFYKYEKFEFLRPRLEAIVAQKGIISCEYQEGKEGGSVLLEEEVCG